MKRLSLLLSLVFLSLLIAPEARSQGAVHGLSQGCPPEARAAGLLPEDVAKLLPHRTGALASGKSGDCSFSTQVSPLRASEGVRIETRQSEDYVLEWITQWWDGDDWYDHERSLHSFSFDAEGNLTRELVRLWEDDEWINSWLYLYEYDEEGRPVSILTQEWDGDEWEDSYRQTFTYEEDGEEIRTDEEWTGSAWVNQLRYRDLYDEEGRLEESIREEWEDRRWTETNRTIHTYDDEDHLVEVVNYGWYNEEYDIVSQGSYTYDEEGREIEEVRQIRQGSRMVNSTRFTREYDAQGRLVESLAQYWDNEWVDSVQTFFAYDEEGRLTEIIYQGHPGASWENLRREVYVYLAAPEAVADVATTEEDTAVEIDVLANDAEAAEAAVSITVEPGHGTAEVGEDGTITYTPEEGFTGTDTFTYSVDNRGGTSEATVTVTVTGVNDAPSAPTITSPSDEATLVIGGAEGEAPADPRTAITIAVEDAEDPEGEEITYRWELALDPDFEEIIASVELEAAGKVELEVTYGMIAEALDEAGVELGDEVELYHRVVASDGGQETASEVFRITLVRGTLVATEGQGDLPRSFALHAAYPNPFNPQAAIPFDVAEPGEVSLRVYDALGREVATLVNGAMSPGRHEVTWQAVGMPSGMYLVRMEASGRTFTQRIVLMK